MRSAKEISKGAVQLKALVVTDVANMELLDMDRPKIKDDEVLVKVAFCGICGSDLPRFFDGGVHAFPQVLGHEFSGVVEEIGATVTKLKKGDRVAVAPLVPLTPPEDWAGNNPAMGGKYSFIGSRQQGAMAEFVAVPEENCVIVPDSLPLDEAALVEPLTVAIHGVERLNLRAGATVLVLGAGTIGLLTVAVLRARGVGSIVVVDLNSKKLAAAKLVGADVGINPNEFSLEDYYDKNDLPEIVVETAGSHVTQKQALDFVSKMGQIAYIGTMTKPISFEPEEFEQILRKEVTITGAWMSYSGPFPGFEWTAALRYMDSKVLDISSLITGYFALEDKEKPFELMVEKESPQIKLLYKISGEQ